MGKLIFFLKKYDSYIAIGLILLLVTVAIIRGKIYSQRINENSALCYGFIFKEGKQLTYYYNIDSEFFKGNINSQSGKNKVGDTLIIQYNTRNPTFHIIHSKKDTIPIEKIKKKFVRIWDAI